MKIQLVAIVNSGMGLDDSRVFVNDQAAAETYYNELLDQLGYDGDKDDFEDISNYLGELSDENLIMEAFDLPVWLSIETIETLNQLDRWAQMHQAPDFQRVSAALAELTAAL